MGEGRKENEYAENLVRIGSCSRFCTINGYIIVLLIPQSSSSPLIHSFNKNISGTYYVPDTSLGIRDIAINKNTCPPAQLFPCSSRVSRCPPFPGKVLLLSQQRPRLGPAFCRPQLGAPGGRPAPRVLSSVLPPPSRGEGWSPVLTNSCQLPGDLSDRDDTSHQQALPRLLRSVTWCQDLCGGSG